jgi:peroxiredoxin
MKKILLFFMLLYPFSLWAQSGHFDLSISVKGLEKPAVAYLWYTDGGKQRLDSVKAITGTFEFSGELSGICRARLTLDHAGIGLAKLGPERDMLAFFLEKGHLTVSATDSIKNGIISGSKVNQQNAIYKKMLAGNDQAFQSLVAISSATTPEKRKDPNFRPHMDSLYRNLNGERERLQIDYIKQYPDSYISYLALVELTGPIIDVDKIEPLFNSLSDRLKNSPTGLVFKKNIILTKNTAIGATAPDFSQNDVNDHPVRLSQFRGKYVLLDFWASWCGPCRAENPNVLKAYQQYHDKNFTVLGVSLDRPGKKDDWLTAIKADKLEWTQVSDLKFWENEAAKLYGVRAIPQNFLIDPNGKIIAKNLSGEELNEKLKSILSH